MEFSVARALQVSQLEEGELKRLQALESTRGNCLPNWNIQELLRKSTLKAVLNIPDDPNDQQTFTQRIKNTLSEKGWLTGFPHELELDRTHAFDWTVWKNRHSVVWEFAERTSQGRRLRDYVEK
jgi:hypothetical protein